MEYITNRLFLAQEKGMQSLSSSILARVEQRFREIVDNEDTVSSKVKDKKQKLWNILFQSSREEIIERIRVKLVKSYDQWSKGNYEQVLSNALALVRYELNDLLEVSSGNYGELLDRNVWKTIRGQYIIEDALSSGEAQKEINDNLSKWGWILSTQNSPTDKNSSDKQSISEEEERITDTVWGTADNFLYAFSKIIDIIEKFHKLVKSHKLLPYQEAYCISNLNDIYRDFGGYYYAGAIDKANSFFNHMIGSTDLCLQRDMRNVSTYIFDGESKNPFEGIIDDDILITKVENLAPFEIKLRHIDKYSKGLECSLKPGYTAEYNNLKKISFEGRWYSECIDPSGPKPFTDSICIRVRWKIENVNNTLPQVNRSSPMTLLSKSYYN